jgi:hypothetical protein
MTPKSMYKHLAEKHKTIMKNLEVTYGGIAGIRKHPDVYSDCLESKVAYHTYMGLHWKRQIGKPGVNQAAVIKNSNSYRRMQEKVLKELLEFRKEYPSGKQ